MRADDIMDKNRRKDITIEKIIYYKNNGYLVKDIANIFNCSEVTITARFNKKIQTIDNNDIKVGFEKDYIKILEHLPKRDKNNTSRHYYKCLCTLCNNEFILRKDVIHKSKSCGCYNYKSKSKFVGNILISKFSRIKDQAQERNLDFSISIEYVDKLYELQNKKCAISNIDITLPDSSANIYSGTASLDRIDSNIGYIEGNVQWVHKDINMMKINLKQEKFIEYCQTITEYQKSKGNI